jgi:DNA-binding NarL/FixJ family response regulator
VWGTTQRWAWWTTAVSRSCAPPSPGWTTSGPSPPPKGVLDLLGAGLTNDEIGARLFISSKTVDHHVSAVLTKLGAGNRREAVRIAAASGLVSSSSR